MNILIGYTIAWQISKNWHRQNVFKFAFVNSKYESKMKLTTAIYLYAKNKIFRSSPPEVFLGKVVLKISKFSGEYPCRSAVLIQLPASNFFETAIRHGCSPVNLLHTFSWEHFYRAASKFSRTDTHKT